MSYSSGHVVTSHCLTLLCFGCCISVAYVNAMSD